MSYRCKTFPQAFNSQIKEDQEDRTSFQAVTARNGLGAAHPRLHNNRSGILKGVCEGAEVNKTCLRVEDAHVRAPASLTATGKKPLARLPDRNGKYVIVL